MTCPFCNNIKYKKSYLPSTEFNGKIFNYFQCTNCKLIYINPMPSVEDFELMYPPSYQNGVNTKLIDIKIKLIGLRYSYKYQFDIIKKYLKANSTMLDYGCGDGNFVVNALNYGINCRGAEFNNKHVALLRASIDTDFFLIEDVLNGSIPKFDLIRLSNVLEHLPHPKNIINKLLNRLKPNGMLLIEGPIETNANFALFTRKIYFKISKIIKPDRIVNHVPTHQFFSNRKNQLMFFDQLGLETIHYNISEAEWPYPNTIKTKGLANKSKYLIARFSIYLSSFNNKSGNTFIYVGKRK